MIGLGGGKFEYGLNILFLKIRVVSQNVFRGDSSREEVQQILNSHPHATSAGAPANLSRLDRDASQVVQSGHPTAFRGRTSLSLKCPSLQRGHDVTSLPVNLRSNTCQVSDASSFFGLGSFDPRSSRQCATSRPRVALAGTP